MREHLLGRLLGAAAITLFAALPATANIYLDENFDDDTPFEDIGWPIADNETFPTAEDIAAKQGINVRSSGEGGEPDGDPVQVTTTGTIDGTLSFSGNSLKLESGQLVELANTADYAYSEGDHWRVFQFAATVDAASLELPAGTQVGSFLMEYSDALESTDVVVTYQINFVRNEAGGVDLVRAAVGTAGEIEDATVGTISAAGEWHVVSVLMNRHATGVYWEAWDPLTETYKGPQPVDTSIPPPDPDDLSHWQIFESGFYTFIDSNDPTNVLTGAEMGEPILNGSTLPNLINWEIAAENGGNLYIDEMSWSHGLFQDGKAINGSTQDGSARLLAFDAEPDDQPIDNAVQNWMWME